MSDRPILYSAPMVRAILSGAKTQTRRTRGLDGVDPRGSFIEMRRGDDGKWRAAFDVRDDAGPLEVVSPFGGPGDRLWVRETWRIAAWRTEGPKEGAMALDYRASPEGTRSPWVFPPSDVFERLVQQSSDDARSALKAEQGSVREDGDGLYRWDHGDSPCRWRPSIHMPRWASRLTLEVTGVRVERLNDISEADAMAEGAAYRLSPGGDLAGAFEPMPGEALHPINYRSHFRDLWESINDPGSWALNPWVWVVQFKRVTP